MGGPFGLKATIWLKVPAQISAADISTLAANSITVSNPSPGGGISNSRTFAVPCEIPPPAPAAAQTRARLGAFYFDGWTGPLTNFHFDGLPRGPYQQREPLTGWQDNNDCAVEKQLALAHNFGIDFFVYEWYFNTTDNAAGENLNSAPPDDPRPWDERSSTGQLTWYSRTPQDVANFVSDAIDWANSNPQLRPEPSAAPLVLITSWNEMGEGNHLLPTVEDGTSYGDALATMLTGP